MHNLLEVANRSEQYCTEPREQGWQQVCQQGTLFIHYNDVFTTFLNHQYCYNLLTKLSNNDNNSEQPCSINIGSSFSITVVASSMQNNIVKRIVNNIVRSTTSFSHDNSVVTTFSNQQCYYNFCIF